LEEAKVYQGLQ